MAFIQVHSSQRNYLAATNAAIFDRIEVTMLEKRLVEGGGIFHKRRGCDLKVDEKW